MSILQLFTLFLFVLQFYVIYKQFSNLTCILYGHNSKDTEEGCLDHPKYIYPPSNGLFSSLYSANFILIVFPPLICKLVHIL